MKRSVRSSLKRILFVIGIVLAMLSAVTFYLYMFEYSGKHGSEVVLLASLILAVPSLILIIVGYQKTTVTICDGCKEVIQGDFIAITSEGTERKYDYCNKTCRDEYHAQILEKFKNTPPNNNTNNRIMFVTFFVFILLIIFWYFS